MDRKCNRKAMGTSVLLAWLTNTCKQRVQQRTMVNTTSFIAMLDEVAGMEEFLVDSPRVKGLLANLRKLRSLEASQLEWFFTVLRRKLSQFAR